MPSLSHHLIADWGDMVMNPCDTMTNQATSSTVSSTDSTYPYSRFLVQCHTSAQPGTKSSRRARRVQSECMCMYKCHASDVISRLGGRSLGRALSKVQGGCTRCPLIYVPCPCPCPCVRCYAPYYISAMSTSPLIYMSAVSASPPSN